MPNTDDASPRTSNPNNIIVCPCCGEEIEHNGHPHHPGMTIVKNILVLVSTALFSLSILISESHFLWKAIAYGAGTLAYFGELLAITHFFKRRCTMQELLMPIAFGTMYIVLGIYYAVEHFA